MGIATLSWLLPAVGAGHKQCSCSYLRINIAMQDKWKNGGAAKGLADGVRQEKNDKKEASSCEDSITGLECSYMGLPFAEDFLPFMQGQKRKKTVSLI